jgi:hypothetical protein
MESPKDLLSKIHTNDLPLRIRSICKPMVFADDTSIVISSRNFEDFCSMSNLVLSLIIIKWLTANKLVLSLDKTNIRKFVSNNLSHCTLHIGYKEKYIEETVNTKILGLQIDSQLNWKNILEKMISELHGA